MGDVGMHYIGPAQYQPEWIQKLARVHNEDAKVVSVYRTQHHLILGHADRDREGEERSALAGLYIHVAKRMPKHSCSVSKWTGKELKDQFGFDPTPKRQG